MHEQKTQRSVLKFRARNKLHRSSSKKGACHSGPPFSVRRRVCVRVQLRWKWESTQSKKNMMNPFSYFFFKVAVWFPQTGRNKPSSLLFLCSFSLSGKRRGVETSLLPPSWSTKVYGMGFCCHCTIVLLVEYTVADQNLCLNGTCGYGAVFLPLERYMSA